MHSKNDTWQLNLSLLTLLELAFSEKKYGYLIGVTLVYLLYKHFLYEYLSEGYADIPVAFMALTALVPYFRNEDLLADKKDFILTVILAAAAAFYFLFLGSPSRQVLVSVNGEKITVEQFNREVEKAKLPERDMYKEEPQQFLEGMVLRTLILQEAKKEGIAV